VAALWRDLRDQLLPQFVQRHPGRRPRCWWDYDAPRQPVGTWPGWWLDGKLSEPRLRLGGTGTPKHEVLAYVPRYDYGIPVYWVEPAEFAYYNGLEVAAVNGQRTEREGKFKGVPIDPNDPPVYEAQATYLERHDLFLPGERRRLRKADFEPEAVAA
jgi:hypothetical protein